MSGRQRWRAIGVRAALASAFLIAITVAVAYVATEARWFSPPYGAFGKQLAWALSIPEGAYNFDVVIPGRLYRSALPDARLVERLRQVHGVERLVSLAGPFESHQKARDLGIDPGWRARSRARHHR
jgi:hypothetical protein